MIKIAREEACQVIVATYPNDIMLCAAYMAAKTLGLPLIPYFHNTYLEYMAEKGGVDYAVSRVLQPRVFKRAKVVCVISEGMRESLCGRYPEVRFEVLPHSFSGEPPVPVAQRRIAGRVRVAFLGTLSEANWDAMGRVASAVSAPETNCELTICSATPNDVFRRCGFADARVIYRRPSDRELISVLRQHDILLLPHGFSGTWPSIEYRTIFPTRTIPYLLSGRPILAHAPPDCFLSKWLRERKCADVVDVRSSDAVRVALQRLAADVDRRTEMARNGLLAVESFRAETVGAKLRKVVDDAVEETGRKYELKERAQEDG
jgi:glycosyltransferase involved in cell wall biosynthesis